MKLVVMGLGRSGAAVAALAARQGHDVVGVDLRTDLDPIEGVRLELGPHRRSTFLAADQIVVSPGIPSTQADLQAAHAAGIEVIGELGWAARQLSAPMVAITGTNGKSTVTWFTAQLCRAAGLKTFAGGNLGNALSGAIGGDYDALVVEVSSYQLEWPGELRPRAGVILNISPDHLKRHGDMATYIATKRRLFARMHDSDLSILPFGEPRLPHLPEPGTRAWLGGLPGVVRHGDAVIVRIPGVDAILSLDGFAIPGDHNRDNAATAALLALSLGADPVAVQRALPTLEALEHRMEVVAEIDGVTWINDSKATNLDALRTGLAGLGRPAVVLLGGQAKGPGFADLVDVLGPHRLVTFGGSGPAIADELADVGLEVTRSGSMADAVAAALPLTRSGDVLLLSPGCASFDEFDDFEHRGRVFRELARLHGDAP